MGTYAEQKREYNRAHRCLQAARKWQRGDGSGGEVERDGNEVGYRDHLIA
jgi:hypothetical protein